MFRVKKAIWRFEILQGRGELPVFVFLRSDALSFVYIYSELLIPDRKFLSDVHDALDMREVHNRAIGGVLHIQAYENILLLRLPGEICSWR